MVLVFTPPPATTNGEFEPPIRLGALRVSGHLAQRRLGSFAPDEVDQYQLDGADTDLPRAGYVDQVQQQGFLAQTFLYARSVDSIVPTLLHLNEYFDGAVVSGMIKVPTLLRMNHSVIKALYRHHRHDLNFIGVIFCRGHFEDHLLKERNGQMLANVARILGVQAAVMTLEGTGLDIRKEYYGTVEEKAEIKLHEYATGSSK